MGKNNLWDKHYRNIESMWVGRFALGFVIIFAIGVLVLDGFLVLFLLQNLLKPNFIIVSLLSIWLLSLSIAPLFGSAIRSLKKQDEPAGPFEAFLDEIRIRMGYSGKVNFRVNGELNASAGFRYGVFGKMTVTIGGPLLLSRDYDAVRFVVGHEIAHLKNTDNWKAVITYIALAWSERFFGMINPNRNNSVIFLGGNEYFAQAILFAVSAPVYILLLVVRAAARKIWHGYEFRADADSIETFGSEAAKRAFRLLAFSAYLSQSYPNFGPAELGKKFLNSLPIDETTSEIMVFQTQDSYDHPSMARRFRLAEEMTTTRPDDEAGKLIYEKIVDGLRR